MNHIQEAVRDWAYWAGKDYPDRQWLLSHYDTWEVNPHYVGPEQRHPEDYDYDEEPFDFNSDAEADADVLASAGMGTDEDYGYFGDDVEF